VYSPTYRQCNPSQLPPGPDHHRRANADYCRYIRKRVCCRIRFWAFSFAGASRLFIPDDRRTRFLGRELAASGAALFMRRHSVGDASDFPVGIAVDSAGSAYVVGSGFVPGPPPDRQSSKQRATDFLQKFILQGIRSSTAPNWQSTGQLQYCGWNCRRYFG